MKRHHSSKHVFKGEKKNIYIYRKFRLDLCRNSSQDMLILFQVVVVSLEAFSCPSVLILCLIERSAAG